MPTTLYTDRLVNFSAGPAVLPVPVLERVRDDLLCLPGVGSSILEISHRSPAFIEILESTKAGIRELLDVPDGYSILFLQGGSRLQFSMVPMNLLGQDTGAADYIVTGSWGSNAVKEAKKIGDTRVIWDGAANDYRGTPPSNEVEWSSAASYVHVTSNETIQGVQFATLPASVNAPLVCDASSDFLSRPLTISDYGLIYACAQKNAGPAGVTIVIIRDDLLDRSSDSLPGYLNYRKHADADSCFNTPPTFAVYVVGLVVEWLKSEMGGLAKMETRNREKAKLLYDVMDVHDGFYAGHAEKADRSQMNVTFRLPTEQLESEFIKAAKAEGMTDLKGHRSVGGIRASIYNAMPMDSVAKLAGFMKDFASRH